MLIELNEQQVEHVLRTAKVARIGCYGDGRVYVVPVAYAYDGHAIYSLSRPGSKLRMMRERPEVCIEVDDVQSLSDWRSVIAWGTYEELSGDDAQAGRRLIESHFAPPMLLEALGDPETAGGDVRIEAMGLVVYRIVLGERTGRGRG
jgi:nitroimidazol reductase NimA-like FMN-containing flavoprotein (pyridoxamine 5'-phosphate oxidase superfamily)